MRAWQIALLAFLGITLLRNNFFTGQSPAPVGASGGGGFSFFSQAEPALPGLPADVTPGLIATSGDEDIGIAPAPMFAAPEPATSAVVVQDSNTPVIEQTPTFVPQTFRVEGSSSEGFSLSGPTEGLTGSTQIRVAEFVGFAPGETFATTPDVLARFLEQFN